MEKAQKLSLLAWSIGAFWIVGVAAAWGAGAWIASRDLGLVVMGALFIVVIGTAYARLIAPRSDERPRRSTRVQLRRPSGRTWGGGYWSSRVSYDQWGAPYARAHDFGSIALYPDGKTGDYNLYRTEWCHLSGPPVGFGPGRKAGQ